MQIRCGTTDKQGRGELQDSQSFQTHAEMDQRFTFVLLLLSLFSAFGKYVFIDEKKTWHEAQDFCRQYHTELAPVSSDHDMKLLRDLFPYNNYIIAFWFGLERNHTDPKKWKWSGAGEVSKFFWDYGQPSYTFDEDNGFMLRDKWHDASSWYYVPFFCYKVFVVRERKTWVEALDYCREHHKDLASVASEAEMTLIWGELDKNETSDHVWIGLRFFPGRLWLWTDGQPTDYQAWNREEKPACPRAELECAALKMREEMQSGNSANATLSANASMSLLAEITAVNVPMQSDAAESVEEKVWEAHDCEEKMYFVCY